MVMEEMPTPRETHVLSAASTTSRASGCARRSRPIAAAAGRAQAQSAGTGPVARRPEQPADRRVAVNRLWQLHFGTGLVKTAEDFGRQGEWPSPSGPARLAGGRVHPIGTGT